MRRNLEVRVAAKASVRWQKYGLEAGWVHFSLLWKRNMLSRRRIDTQTDTFIPKSFRGVEPEATSSWGVR
jgi:hypothetical protein